MLVPLARQSNYFKMNARIGLTANTPLRGGAGKRSLIGFVEEPRMYGLTVRAKF